MSFSFFARLCLLQREEGDLKKIAVDYMWEGIGANDDMKLFFIN